MKIFRVLLILSLVIVSCSEDSRDEEGAGQTDNFDRGAMLANWADNIIVPAFKDFKTHTQNLEDVAIAFNSEPTETNLMLLRTAFRVNYQEFQKVSMFETGPAEEVNYRSFLNTYPVDVNDLNAKISSGSYNLDLPSSYDEQGFPALDYLLYGVADNPAGVLAFHADSEKHRQYVVDVATRINSLTNQITTRWEGDYRDTFVSNVSSSSTGSVDRFTNDFVMYVEKIFRSGKIGYPAGAFTGEPVPGNVEALYAGDFSKTLYLESLGAVENFIYGNHYDGNGTGPGYTDYLDYLDEMKDGARLSSLISDRLGDIRDASANLDDNFKNQVETDNTKMLESFDELQKLVILLKLDMMQALSISVDYVDSDGD